MWCRQCFLVRYAHSKGHHESSYLSAKDSLQHVLLELSFWRMLGLQNTWQELMGLDLQQQATLTQVLKYAQKIRALSSKKMKYFWRSPMLIACPYCEVIESLLIFDTDATRHAASFWTKKMLSTSAKAWTRLTLPIEASAISLSIWELPRAAQIACSAVGSFWILKIKTLRHMRSNWRLCSLSWAYCLKSFWLSSMEDRKSLWHEGSKSTQCRPWWWSVIWEPLEARPPQPPPSVGTQITAAKPFAY